MKKQDRASNIELLRIISILLIIASHYVGHGVFQVGNDNAYLIWEKGVLGSKIATIILTPGGKVGVAIFFIIGGYFNIYKTKIPNLSNTIKQTFFYSLFMLIISVLCYCFKIMSIGLNSVLVSFQNAVIPVATNAWWFVTTYILLMLLSPYLNKIVRNASKTGIVVLLMMTGIAYGIIGQDTVYYNILRAPFFYIIGSLSRIHKDEIDKKIINKKSILILSAILVWMCYCACTWIWVKEVLNNNRYIILRIIDALRIGIFIPMISVELFYLFLHVKLHSLIVNRLAEFTFPIYLIHDSIIGRKLIWNVFVCPKKIYLMGGGKLYLNIIISILLVFSICAVFDFLLKFVFEGLIDHISDKVIAFCNNELLNNKEEMED